jgi:hypothetical protein
MNFRRKSGLGRRVDVRCPGLDFRKGATQARIGG